MTLFIPYFALPSNHWPQIRTNNPLERIIREIRRRTRVVGAFPDGERALNLAAARLRHIAATDSPTRRRYRRPSKKSPDQQPTTPAKVRKTLDTTGRNGPALAYHLKRRLQGR